MGMPFNVLAAADLSGKCNYEISFHALPTVPELRERVEVVLGAEAAVRRPPQAGPFQIHRVQVFDERMEMWVDLVASSQLEDYCQVYLFQKESPYHRDTPGRIPPPVKPTALVSATHSTQPRQYGSAPPSTVGSAVPPPFVGAGTFAPAAPPAVGSIPARGHSPGAATHGEKVRAVFAWLDLGRRRRVSVEDWQASFEKVRLCGDAPGASNRFDPATVEDLFKKADRDGDDIVTPDELQHFCEIYPKLLDSVYYRIQAADLEAARAQRLDAERRRLDDLESQLNAAQDGAAQADRDAEDKKRAVDDADANIGNAKANEEAAARDKDAAHAATEDVRGKLMQTKKDLQTTRDAGRGREAEKRKMQGLVDTAEKKQKAVEADRDRAERAVELLKKQLAQAEEDLRKQEGNVDAAKDGVDQAKQKYQDSLDPAAERDLEDKQGAVNGLEGDLKGAQDEEARLAKNLRDVQRAAQQVAAQKAAAEREAGRLSALADQRRNAEQAAQRAADGQREAIAGLEGEDKVAEAKRTEDEERENELLNQEVRLREQREVVERQEARLRTAHRDFTHDIGRLNQ